MPERITLEHVKTRLAHLQQLYPQFSATWQIDSCANKTYRIYDTQPKNGVQYPLSPFGVSARQLFNLLVDSIEPLFQSMAKPLSAETVEIHHHTPEVSELAGQIANFLENCDDVDVVKLANCAFSENYVLVVE